MKIVTVHGFNVKDKGSNTTDRIAACARREGYTIDLDEGDYGYFNLLSIRFFKRKQRQRVLYRLANAFETADVIITHSNGANFTTQALDMLPDKYKNTKQVIHISPALDCDTPLPQAVKKQLVMFTPHDGWVKVATYLPFHDWGRMGARGYRNGDLRNENFCNPLIRKHSDWFSNLHLASTWKTCKLFIKEHS